MKKQTLEQLRQQIRDSIKRENQRGIWESFWRDIELLSW